MHRRFRIAPSRLSPFLPYTALSLLSVQAVLAQEPAPAEGNSPVAVLPEIVVTTQTALRTDEDILNVPQTVSILDQETILRNQPRTPNEMLKGQPGVWAVSVAAQGSPIIRGQIGNRVLYLWDGVRINNGALFAGPNGFFNQFPVGAIERMEVVRGAGSVAYGSDAIGGVINIIPKKAVFSDHLTISGDVSARYGTNDDEDTQIYDVFITDQKFSLAAGLSWQNVNDYEGADVGKLSPTGFNTLGGYVDFAYKLTDDQTIRLSWFQNNRTDVGYYVQSKLNANGIPRITDPFEQRGIAKLDYTLTDLGSWSSELKFYGYYQYYNAVRERNVDALPSYTVTSSDTEQRVFGLGVQNTITLDKFQFIYGLDYRDEDLAGSQKQDLFNKTTGDSFHLTPAGGTPNGFYGVFDAFLMTQYRPIESLLLSAGVRFENTQIDSDPSPINVIPNAGYTIDSLTLDKSWQSITWNTGAIYSINTNWDLVANINTAFRTPTYSDLFSSGPPVFSSKTASVPSPGLDPEKSITYEVGPRYHTSQFNGSLTGYWTELSDLVISTTSGTVDIPGQGTFIASHKVNGGRGYVTGVELAASYKPSPEWTIFGNATYTYGQNTSNDVPLRFIPPLNGLLGVRYEAPGGRWWVEANEIFAATFDRPAPEDLLDAGFSKDPAYGSSNTKNNPPYRADFHIPGFTLTNLRGGFKVWERAGRSFNITVDINNLFDKHYREVYAQQELAAPGFGVVIGARLVF